jgi:hypothetical protein
LLRVNTPLRTQTPPPGSMSSLSDAERKEKLALEKKLSEMEEELKV